jgi:UDP-glucose 4-epimerase
MKTFLVTGGAGFIGSALIERLLQNGGKVVCADDYSLGSRKNIERFFDNDNFQFFQKDISAQDNLENIIETLRRNGGAVDYIFHMAANSDIRASGEDPAADFRKTFLTTYNILECMRKNKITKMFFPSSGAVYGEKPGAALSEDSPLAPISYYGGSKMASEAFISAYSAMNDFDVAIFRFPNVIGPRLTHGVVYDFINKLKQNPSELEILGDGSQNKSYIYVEDLIDVILQTALGGGKGVNIHNISAEGSTTVNEIAGIVCAGLGLKNARYKYTGGDRGWKGDIPSFIYDAAKIHNTGWKAKYSSTQAVELAVRDAMGTSEGREYSR